MQIINSGRGSGKTYTLVQWLLQDPDKRVIIVPTEQMARWMRSDYNLSASQVISAINAPDWFAVFSRREVSVAFDEAEHIIEHAFRGLVGESAEIAIFTSTIEEYVAHPKTALEEAEDLERRARAIRLFNGLPPQIPEPTVSPEVTRLIELGDQLGSAVRDFLNKK